MIGYLVFPLSPLDDVTPKVVWTDLQWAFERLRWLVRSHGIVRTWVEVPQAEWERFLDLAFLHAVIVLQRLGAKVLYPPPCMQKSKRVKAKIIIYYACSARFLYAIYFNFIFTLFFILFFMYINPWQNSSTFYILSFFNRASDYDFFIYYKFWII